MSADHEPSLHAKALQMIDRALDAGLAAPADAYDLLSVGYDAAKLTLDLGLRTSGSDPVAGSRTPLGLSLAVSTEPDDGFAAHLQTGLERIVAICGVPVEPIDVHVDDSVDRDGWMLRLAGDEIAHGQLADGADAAAAIATAIVDHLHELLTREMVADLLDQTRLVAPMVVHELVPNLLSLGQLRQVLQGLVRERVPIRNMPAILNALADQAIYTKDPAALGQHARAALGRSICAPLRSGDGTLRHVRVAPATDNLLQRYIQLTEAGQELALDDATLAQLIARLRDALDVLDGAPPVLMTSTKIRRHVRELTRRAYPALTVLSSEEIPDDVVCECAATISLDTPDAATDIEGDVSSMRW